MARRPYWKGHIRLSLVSFEVQLHTATRGAREFPLHQIDKKSGERIRYQTVVPGKGPVPREQIVKGYEFEKDRYVLFDPDELEKLKIESRHTIDLVQFVHIDDIDAIYFDKPYFVAPGNALSAEAYRVVRDALRATKKCALGQIVLGGRERVAALKPCGKGMVLETLRYGEEVRRASSYFDAVKDGEIDDEQIDLAKQLIEQKSSKFDPDKFKDHYDDAMRELIKAKLGDKKAQTSIEAPRPTAQVIDLMDALKKSLRGAKSDEAGSHRTKHARKPKRKTRKRAA
ncbi:MAG: Ku protein [Rhodospirillaceae bacterium]|nr:Ku protein [Rhodospirillaceae bacterium]